MTVQASASRQVQSPLTLVMKIKSPADYQALRLRLDQIQSLPPDQNRSTVALTNIKTVHFARFVFLENNTRLAVITSFDGDFKKYVMDFVDKLGEIFDFFLTHMEGAPPLPVKTHPDEFLQYVMANDVPCVGPFFSAYPTLPVIKILQLADTSP
jgi:hypothetical protein